MGQLPPLHLAETQRQALGGELYGGEEKVQVRLLEALGKSKWGEWWLPIAVAFDEWSGRHTFFFFFLDFPKLEAEKKLREAAVTKLQLFCYRSNYGLLPWLLIVDVVGQSHTIMHDLAVVPVYVLSLLPKDF